MSSISSRRCFLLSVLQHVQQSSVFAWLSLVDPYLVVHDTVRGVLSRTRWIVDQNFNELMPAH